MTRVGEAMLASIGVESIFLLRVKSLIRVRAAFKAKSLFLWSVGGAGSFLFLCSGEDARDEDVDAGLALVGDKTPKLIDNRSVSVSKS